MHTSGTVTAVLLAFSAISSVQAQTPPNTAPDPSSASSPHQRDVTGSTGQETPAQTEANPTGASSPHQREATSRGMAGSAGMDPATFVKKAAEGGLTEVALSKAAEASSQDPKVRQFAGQMVRDHSKANDELASLAKSKGIKVPKSLDSEHQAMVQKLSNKKGADFDSAYSKQMVADHDKTIALFQAAANSSDPDLAAFAKKTLPTLTEHKHMADELPGAMRSAQAGGTGSETK